MRPAAVDMFGEGRSAKGRGFGSCWLLGRRPKKARLTANYVGYPSTETLPAAEQEFGCSSWALIEQAALNDVDGLPLPFGLQSYLRFVSVGLGWVPGGSSHTF